MAIKAGVYDCVLAVGVEQMGKGLLGGAGGGEGIPTEGLLGSGTMPSVFAHVGMEHSAVSTAQPSSSSPKCP